MLTVVEVEVGDAGVGGEGRPVKHGLEVVLDKRLGRAERKTKSSVRLPRERHRREKTNSG